MNSQETTNIINLLLYILIPVIMILLILIAYAIFIYLRNKNKEEQSKESSSNNDLNVTSTNSMQNKQSIFKFMEFDEVTDNMIIQKKHTRFQKSMILR